VDAFADKYYDVSPYQYALNNPIVNVDINGDSVWVTTKSVTDANGNTTINHTIHITGKVLKQGSGSTKAGDLAKGLNSRLNAQNSSTSTEDSFGRTTTVNTSIEANFTAASSMDDVASSDHLVVIVDDVEGKADPSLGGGDAGGIAKTPGKISYVESKGAVETAFHEVGHNLGLPHPSSNSSGDPMSYSGRGSNFSTSQMSTILTNAIRGTPNSGSNSALMRNHFPGMHQGSFDPATNGRPFQVAPSQRSIIPLPVINKRK
jgi:hypothetical protein